MGTLGVYEAMLLLWESRSVTFGASGWSYSLNLLHNLNLQTALCSRL